MRTPVLGMSGPGRQVIPGGQPIQRKPVGLFFGGGALIGRLPNPNGITQTPRSRTNAPRTRCALIGDISCLCTSRLFHCEGCFYRSRTTRLLSSFLATLLPLLNWHIEQPM